MASPPLNYSVAGRGWTQALAHIFSDIQNAIASSMLKKLSSLQSGTLGELLAVAKLNTLGFAAYISPEGAPGHDIIVVVDGQAKSIEVKTRQFLSRPSEITRWPVDMEAKRDADFFLFIELDLRTLSPNFYLLTNIQARETYKNYIGGGNCTPPHVRRLVNPNDFSALDGEAHS
nr:hypothetical protein [uncultured Brevundimonas sp.]